MTFRFQSIMMIKSSEISSIILNSKKTMALYKEHSTMITQELVLLHFATLFQDYAKVSNFNTINPFIYRDNQLDLFINFGEDIC